MYRITGAFFVVCGCALIGRVKVTADKRNIRLVGEFIKAINMMICEVEFHKTPLPSLCSFVAERTEGIISGYFSELGKELSRQVSVNVKTCSDLIIKKRYGDISADMQYLFNLVGESLGMFGIGGQVEQLQYVKSTAENTLRQIQNRFETLGHSHQTLWICAGVALAVIMI